MAGVDDNENQAQAPETGPAGSGGAASGGSGGSGAVDTGRRIDPAQLRSGSTIRRGEKPSDRRGGRPPKREPEVIRIGQPQPPPEETGAAPDAGTAPAPEGTDAPREERSERRGDRGAPRGGRGDRGDRGPRRDRGRGEGGPRAERGERPRGPQNPKLDFSDMAPIVVKRDAPEDVGDFAAMLAATGPIDRVDIRVGDKVRATCVHIGSETAFFELSRTQEAQIPLGELIDDEGNPRVNPGDSIDAFVVGLSEGIHLSTRIGKDQIDVGMLEAARQAQMPVQGTVSGINKGGLEVTLAGSARGFCPMGQADLNFVDDPTALMGKTLSFLVREVKENGRNILLSRKALLEKERKELAQKTLATLAVGAMVKGTVTRIQPFGAFVDLGGVDGLIPISELGWSHVKDPSEVLKVGDQVTAEVRRIEPDTKRQGQMRVSLSLKAAQPDPFIAHLDEMHPGAWLVGTVKKLETFGAFVELFPGVQGLVHISAIAERRIAHPREVLNVDEQVRVRVVEADPSSRRVSLSLKEPPPEVEEDAAPAARAERPRGPRVSRGTEVEGAVERIERYGVFLKLDPVDGKELGSALMPASETGTPRGSDLGKAFPVGARVQALVIDIDDRGRLKVSKIAREQAEERALVSQYNASAKGGSGLGTFGDLLKAKLGK